MFPLKARALVSQQDKITDTITASYGVYVLIFTVVQVNGMPADYELLNKCVCLPNLFFSGLGHEPHFFYSLLHGAISS
jgi:hypothetical protein